MLFAKKYNSNYLFVMFILVVFTTTSCSREDSPLKTKIGFNTSASGVLEKSLRLFSGSITIKNFAEIKVDSGAMLREDATLVVEDNTMDLLSAYNSTNGTAVEPFPVSRRSLPSSIIIKADSISAPLDILFNNSVNLDTNKVYAIGLKISTSDNRLAIDNDRGSVLILLRVLNRNIYDGRYSMSGRFYHPTVEPSFAPHNFNIELHTYAPNSVRLFSPLAGDYVLPVTVNGVPNYFGSQHFTLNFVSNDSIFLWNSHPSVSGVVYDHISNYNGTSYRCRLDPITGTIYLAYGYQLGTGGNIVLGSSRAWIDTLVYLGSR